MQKKKLLNAFFNFDIFMLKFGIDLFVVKSPFLSSTY